MSSKVSEPSFSRNTDRDPRQGTDRTPEQKRIRELTEKLAYELYERRGRAPGRAVEDWLAAERIVRERLNGREKAA